GGCRGTGWCGCPAGRGRLLSSLRPGSPRSTLCDPASTGAGGDGRASCVDRSCGSPVVGVAGFCDPRGATRARDPRAAQRTARLCGPGDHRGLRASRRRGGQFCPLGGGLCSYLERPVLRHDAVGSKEHKTKGLMFTEPRICPEGHLPHRTLLLRYAKLVGKPPRAHPTRTEQTCVGVP